MHPTCCCEGGTRPRQGVFETLDALSTHLQHLPLQARYLSPGKSGVYEGRSTVAFASGV